MVAPATKAERLQRPKGPNVNFKSRGSNAHRSFSSLLKRNRESKGIFKMRIKEPINIFPRIEWRPVGVRREILSASSGRRPPFRLRVIRRIWRGQNPQIAPARPITSLKDAIVTLVV